MQVISDDANTSRSYAGNYSVPREKILWGSAGVKILNDTVNGEGDNLFLENVLVIINGMYGGDMVVAITWTSLTGTANTLLH